jgi:hypothetical protein
MPPTGRPAITGPGLLDLGGADAGLDHPRRQKAVANHLLVPGLVFEVGVGIDPGGDLGLDGLGEHPRGPVPEDLGQDVLALG